jgi:hypothetical protein
MPVNTAPNELCGTTNAPDLGYTQIFAVFGKKFMVAGDSTNVYAGLQAFLKTSNFLFLVPPSPGQEHCSGN